MPNFSGYPKIRSVEPRPGKALRVTFDNGVRKEYDCTPLIQHESFRPLQDDAVFRCAHADPYGYGVVWNEEIDLAESEIWLHGRNIEQTAESDADKPRV
ncbi:MAG: DUF2442 domain-containing protein [Spirochaetaceae bacterium]|nr:MAG: DUF2442 domain-containing protein [Spirochaetaceae bacterium]